MPFDWSLLRNPEPTSLAAARALAHRAAQWPARAARANLKATADDSHSALAWDPAKLALISQPLDGGIRVGLRVAVHELVFTKGSKTETCALVENTEAEVNEWLDGKLAQAGLKPASKAKLPYEMPSTAFARAVDEAPHFAALAAWFAAGAEVLEGQRRKYKRFKPGPTPSRCWPHHFDIAMMVELESAKKKSARAIGIGLSPGDDYYAQPYFYLSPYPKPDMENLPPLPPGGRWHTRDFPGAVATAVDLLVLPDPGKALEQILEAAFEECLNRLAA
ncbi:MAG: hypothetical protein ABI423_14650 [Burkholderiales bacterium]